MKLHYAITNSGGVFPNVIPKEASVEYMIRAPHMSAIEGVKKRLDKIAEGAALMTETDVSIRLKDSMSELLPNITLDEIVHQNFVHLGPTPATEEDIRFAEAIRATVSEEQRHADEVRAREALGGDVGVEMPEKRYQTCRSNR